MRTPRRITGSPAPAADPLAPAPAPASPAADRRATWRSVFAVGEFRGLWAAQALSLLGDQLARVALAVLVFNQTGSALLAGLALAVTLLPGVLGGPLLAGLADRYPRREVMVWCNLLSVGLAALMALPGIPLPVLLAVLFVVVMLYSPFAAARAALLTEVFPDDRYTLVQVVNRLTVQGSQVLGYAAGGAVVLAIGPRPALLANAATFAAAAVLVRLTSPWRPAAGSNHDAGGVGKTRWITRMNSGASLVFGNARLRQLVLLAWLATFWVVPEGLATPWAAELGRTALTVGLLMAGCVRLIWPHRDGLIWPHLGCGISRKIE